ncbi:MAG TPA: radical SAM protein [Candidatus Limnocylindrales bacterium]|nr:radical SAM protein [Candidatus Limnocylindrales bacterium]
MKNNFDLGKSPVTITWETTQSCDPDYCLAAGQPERDPLELTAQEAEKLIRDIAELRPPIFLMTGGDPLGRDDIYSMVGYAACNGLRPVMVLRAGPQLTRAAIAELKHAGLARLELTLQGASAELHDHLSRMEGSFQQTLRAIRWANEWRLPVQIRTDISEKNLPDLENIAALLAKHRILMWSVAFPVPKDDVTEEQVPSPGEFEDAFARLYEVSRKVPFKVKTVEAQHYRRYVLQQSSRAARERLFSGQAEFSSEGIPGVMPVNESRGSLFISNTGEVSPGCCLPSVGNVRLESLKEIYRDSELFNALRNVSNLHGKCGRCPFKEICSGSRARALYMTGDMFNEDPACSYEPPPLPGARASSAGNAGPQDQG